jgi:hypothetical protein
MENKVEDNAKMRPHAPTELVVNNPLRRLEQLSDQYAEAEGTFKQRRIKCLVDAYVVAQSLHAIDSDMHHFLGSEFLSELRAPDPKKLLLYIMMALVGAKTTMDEAYENARIYARALQPFFERKATSPDVQAALQREGITKLYEAAMAEKGQPSGLKDTGSAATLPRAQSDQDADCSEDSTQTGTWAEDDTTTALEALLEIARLCHAQTHPWWHDVILLRVGQDTRAALLSLGSEQTAQVMVRQIEDKSTDSFVDLVGCLVGV